MFNRKPSDDQIRTSDNGFVAWERLDTDKLDYDLHLAVKMKFVISHNYMQIKQAWKCMVMEQCELDGTQKQMILMQAIQNNCLAGYMLTGNHSMFLTQMVAQVSYTTVQNETHHLRFLTSVMIGFLFTMIIGQSMFVDRITRQTYPFANEVDCVGG